MGYKIMNREDRFTGLEYDTMEEAEYAISHCPTGYWIDAWYESHFEDIKRSLIYDCNQIQDESDYYKQH